MCIRDRDYRSVIQKTAHFADRILTIQTPDNVRALPAGELAKTVSEYNPNVQAMDTIKDLSLIHIYQRKHGTA